MSRRFHCDESVRREEVEPTGVRPESGGCFVVLSCDDSGDDIRVDEIVTGLAERGLSVKDGRDGEQHLAAVWALGLPRHDEVIGSVHHWFVLHNGRLKAPIRRVKTPPSKA